MNRLFFLLLSVCLMFPACSKDTSKYVTDIIGQWVLMDKNDEEILTDEAFALHFTSKKSQQYAIAYTFSETDKKWVESDGYAYQVNKDHIIISGDDSFGDHFEMDLHILKLNKDYMTYTVSNMTINGEKITDNAKYKLRKVTMSYKDAIVGLWEGKNVTPGVVPGSKDDEVHRWRYNNDGTYVYYTRNDAGEWIPKEDNEGRYFLYGDLFATNWTNDYSTETIGTFCECWIIEILKYTDDKSIIMNWEGRRSNDRKTYFSMKKIKE